MGWVRVEDDFYDHPKFADLGPLAELLYLRGLAWCNRNLTDGFIPRVQGRRLADYAEDCDWLGRSQLPRMLTERLEAFGLWEPVEDGWQVHDYLDYQPSADEIQARRVEEHERKVLAGKRRAAGASRTSRGVFTKGQVSTSTASNGTSTSTSDGTSRRPPRHQPQPQPQVVIQVPTGTHDSAREPFRDRVLRTENGTGTALAVPADAVDGLTALAHRLVAACTARSPDAAARDAAHVVAWASRHVDARLIDEAIGWAEQRRHTPDAIRLPRAIAPVIAGKARDAGLELPQFRPPVA